jgi:hypothetical protein
VRWKIGCQRERVEVVGVIRERISLQKRIGIGKIREERDKSGASPEGRK